MKKTVNVSGFCKHLKQEMTISVRYFRYAPLGTDPMASVDCNFCEHGSKCPHYKNCPIADQIVFWKEI